MRFSLADGSEIEERALHVRGESAVQDEASRRGVVLDAARFDFFAEDLRERRPSRFGVFDGRAEEEFVEGEAVDALTVPRLPRRESSLRANAVRVRFAAETIAFQRGPDLSVPPSRIAGRSRRVVRLGHGDDLRADQ